MKKLKIATCDSVIDSFITDYEMINIHHTDLTDIAAAVTSTEDAHRVVELIKSTGFDIPLFIAFIHPNIMVIRKRDIIRDSGLYP